MISLFLYAHRALIPLNPCGDDRKRWTVDRYHAAIAADLFDAQPVELLQSDRMDADDWNGFTVGVSRDSDRGAAAV